VDVKGDGATMNNWVPGTKRAEEQIEQTDRRAFGGTGGRSEANEFVSPTNHIRRHETPGVRYRRIGCYCCESRHAGVGKMMKEYTAKERVNDE
jgi:hypothetical protein